MFCEVEFKHMEKMFEKMNVFQVSLLLLYLTCTSQKCLKHVLINERKYEGGGGREKGNKYMCGGRG